MLILLDDVLLCLWNVVLCVFIHDAHSEAWVRVYSCDELVFSALIVNCWLVISYYFPVHESIPINSVEEGM